MRFNYTTTILSSQSSIQEYNVLRTMRQSLGRLSSFFPLGLRGFRLVCQAMHIDPECPHDHSELYH